MSSKTAVILGYLKKNNEQLLLNAIAALKNQTYKNFDIFVYDNSVEENPLEETKKNFPEVKIKHNRKNIGFAGGNNSVMREVLKNNEYQYVALLNDDTAVEPGWLENLINGMEADKKVGAVSSKLLFFEPYLRFKFSVNSPIKFNDQTYFGNSNYTKKFFREGFHSPNISEKGKLFETENTFTIDLPLGKEPYSNKLHLSLKTPENQTITINLDEFRTELELNINEKSYEVTIPDDIVQKNKFNLIQNAGSGISAQFDGYDIGNTQRPGTISSDSEIDNGQYDTRRELEMFCGGAVLFRSETLREVGIFDEYFFVYYEDSDLSLRLRRAGWKIMYEPKAVVRHMHATSSTEYSPLFHYHVTKNKPAFVLKNFNLGPAVKAYWSLLRSAIKSVYNIILYRKTIYDFKTIRAFLKFNLNIPFIILKKFNILKSK